MKREAFETATNTYSAVNVIGNGGSGTVYSVTDSDGQAFALKLLTNASSIKRKRFKNELSFCRRNQHDRIVKVLDEGVAFKNSGHLPFYVMPLYDSTLRKLIQDRLAFGRVLPLFQDALDG